MKPEEIGELVAINEEDSRRTLELIAELRGRCHDRVIDVHSIAAFGAYLHSLYGGVENTLKSLSVHFGIPLPSGEHWHAQLLEVFTKSSESGGKPLFPPALKQKLDEYRGFRHVFRIHYAVELEWKRIEPLLDAAQ